MNGFNLLILWLASNVDRNITFEELQEESKIVYAEYHFSAGNNRYIFVQEGAMTGKFQLYTGNGKGKTTAALGLAVRAACAGMKVYFGQFMKGQDYSELCLPEHFPGSINMEQYGTPRLLCKGEEPSEEDLRSASAGLYKIRTVMISGDYDLIIADELNVTVHMGLLNENDVMEFINQRPDNVELVLTGRYAPASFIEVADLVTEMGEIKHYYATENLLAREGIEF